jgi:signal peptidase II
LQTAGGTTLNEETHHDDRTDADDPPRDLEPTRRPGVVAAYFLIAAAVIGVDWLTKTLVVNALTGAEPVRVLGGLVYLDLTRNSGAAFSIARDYTWALTAIAASVVLFLVWLGRRVRSVPWAIALGLVLGGAAGNLGDRLFREPSSLADRLSGGLGSIFDEPGFAQGHVVDFISVFRPGAEVFPIFNAADSALVCGVILIVLLEFTGRSFSGSRPEPESEEGDE